jgi:maleylacetoacetate isomerase
MKLFTYFQSSGAYRVRIALNLKGLKAEMAFINLLKGEQKNDNYAAVNPQKVIPALIDEGHTLVQSLAIMEYLEETHPATPILPKEPFARAHARALSLVIAADTAPLGNLKVRKHLEEKGFSKDALDAWMRHWIEDGLGAYEKLLARSPYTGTFSLGESPGMADCCLMPQVFNANRWKCDLSPYPLIRGIAEACEKLPAFIEAHPSKQKDAGYTELTLQLE